MAYTEFTTTKQTITDDTFTNTGSTAFRLTDDVMFTDLDFEIWTGAGKTGTQLILNTDYSLQGLIAQSSDTYDDPYQKLLNAGSITSDEKLYTKVQIDNATYQTGTLYISGGHFGSIITISGIREIVDQYEAISTNETITDIINKTYYVTTSTNTITVTLPDAATAINKKYRIEKVDGSTGHVEIVRAGSDTIEGITKLYLPDQYDYVELHSNGTNWTVENIKLSTVYEVNDTKTNGTAGGTSSVGRNIRVLNTEVTNVPWGSLTSNRITLKAGKYEIEAYAPYNAGQRGRLWWYDLTNTTDILHGVNTFTNNASNDQTTGMVKGTITISAETTFELQQYMQSAKTTNGLGIDVSEGSKTEKYSEVFITKLL